VFTISTEETGFFHAQKIVYNFSVILLLFIVVQIASRGQLLMCQTQEEAAVAAG